MIQRPNQIKTAINIQFHALPKWGVFLASMIAIAISINSSDSSANDFGNGILKFRFMMNQLTTIKAQNTAIFHLNAA